MVRTQPSYTTKWPVLQYKAHHPEKFGNLLSKAEILSDKDGVVVCDIVLNLLGRKTQTYQEEITSYGNSWVKQESKRLSWCSANDAYSSWYQDSLMAP